MRYLAVLILLSSIPLFPQASDEQAAVAAVQRTFDGMAAHDAAILHSTLLPDARLYSIREGAGPAVRTGEDFVSGISGMQGGILERFTSPPAVSIRGRMAQVWGEYEFLRDGKFTHCGVDSVSLFKTAEGWKIATIVYTVETTGCKGH